MIRIGIVGSESSHALQFAKYFNLPDPDTGLHRHPNIRVTSIMGDPESAEQTALLGSNPYITQSLEEMSGIVDAVMITSRKGSDHLKQAIPFLDKRLPLFIDKPFTSDPKDAIRLANLIRRAACPVLGGSGCKYCASVQQIKSQVEQLRNQQKLLTAMLHFPIMLDSAYDGFHFYAPHLVEMCLEIFGRDILSMQAIQLENSLVANLKYPDCIVSLHFVTEVWKHSCTLVTTDGPIALPIVTSDSLSETAERFAQMLQGQHAGMTGEALTLPVVLTDAIAQAAASGATIQL